jgi:hypothetical protein
LALSPAVRFTNISCGLRPCHGDENLPPGHPRHRCRRPRRAQRPRPLLTAGETAVGFDALPLPPRAARDFAARPGRLVALQGDVLRAAGLDAAFAAAPVGAVLHAAGAARERADPGRTAAVTSAAPSPC